MPDYNNGKIYKIVCNITQESYVGSTTKPLSKRLTQHVTDYKKHLRNAHPFVSSYPILERGNYDIVLLEEVKCDNKEQLYKEERKHIEANVCVNRNMPLRTWKERRILNQEKHDEYMTQWRNENKEHIKEQRKKYNEDHKEKMKKYRKEYAKRYSSQTTEEQILKDKEKKKEYDKQRRDKIKKSKLII
jgi:hypothetical protein